MQRQDVNELHWSQRNILLFDPYRIRTGSLFQLDLHSVDATSVSDDLLLLVGLLLLLLDHLMMLGRIGELRGVDNNRLSSKRSRTFRLVDDLRIDSDVVPKDEKEPWISWGK